MALRRRVKRRYAGLLVLPVSGGVGLVVYLLSGISLRLTLLAAFLVGATGWLGLKAMDELMTTSVLGHAAYGAVLGWMARRGIKDHVCGLL